MLLDISRSLLELGRHVLRSVGDENAGLAAEPRSFSWRNLSGPPQKAREARCRLRTPWTREGRLTHHPCGGSPPRLTPTAVAYDRFAAGEVVVPAGAVIRRPRIARS